MGKRKQAKANGTGNDSGAHGTGARLTLYTFQSVQRKTNPKRKTGVTTMQNQNVLTVRGVQFDNTKAANYAKALGSVNERLTVFANAAALQYVGYGNNKWMQSLFNISELRNINGALSAKGREVAAYIQHFAPVSIKEMESEEPNEKTVAISLTKNKRKKGKFVSLERDENDARVLVDAVENPDFPLDLREFVAAQKTESKGKKPKAAPKANALSGRLEKISAAFEGNEKPTGTAAEFKALAEQAQALYTQAIAAMVSQAESEDSERVEVDSVMAEMAANTSSKAETRADTNREAASA